MSNFEAPKTHEANESVDKKPVDKKFFNGNKINGKIEHIHDKERMYFNTEQLSKLGTLDKDNPIAEGLYMDKNGKKIDFKIDINKQILTIGDNKIQIDLPHGAYLEKVVFRQNDVKIEGKLGFFSGSGTATYEKVLSAIDNSLKKGETKIASNSGDITFTKVA